MRTSICERVARAMDWLTKHDIGGLLLACSHDSKGSTPSSSELTCGTDMRLSGEFMYGEVAVGDPLCLRGSNARKTNIAAIRTNTRSIGDSR